MIMRIRDFFAILAIVIAILVSLTFFPSFSHRNDLDISPSSVLPSKE